MTLRDLGGEGDSGAEDAGAEGALGERGIRFLLGRDSAAGRLGGELTDDRDDDIDGGGIFDAGSYILGATWLRFLIVGVCIMAACQRKNAPQISTPRPLRSSNA